MFFVFHIVAPNKNILKKHGKRVVLKTFSGNYLVSDTFQKLSKNQYFVSSFKNQFLVKFGIFTNCLH